MTFWLLDAAASPPWRYRVIFCFGMVIKNRIAHLRRLLEMGAKITATVTSNPANSTEKIKLIVNPEVKIGMSHQFLVSQVLVMLDQCCDNAYVADRGHRHSNGHSEVCFYVNHGKKKACSDGDVKLNPDAPIFVPPQRDEQAVNDTNFCGEKAQVQTTMQDDVHIEQLENVDTTLLAQLITSEGGSADPLLPATTGEEWSKKRNDEGRSEQVHTNSDASFPSVLLSTVFSVSIPGVYLPHLNFPSGSGFPKQGNS